MVINEIFFSSTNGLAISTAEHLITKVNDMIKSNQSFLDNITFVTKSVSFANSDRDVVAEYGYDYDKFNIIKETIKNVIDAKAFLLWMNEAMSEKDKLINDINNTSIQTWLRNNKKEYPEQPVRENPITENDYIATLSDNKRSEYFSLKTECDLLKELLFGSLQEAKQNLDNRLHKPVEQIDNIIYTYTPTVGQIDVNSLYFNLNKQYKEKLSVLNKIEYDIQTAVSESVVKTLGKFNTELEKYDDKVRALNNEFSHWKESELIRIQNLKIQVPSGLTDIYNRVKDFV